MSTTATNGALTLSTGSMTIDTYSARIEQAVSDLMSGVPYEDVASNPVGLFSAYVLRSDLRETVQKNLIAAYEAKQACLYGEGVKPS